MKNFRKTIMLAKLGNQEAMDQLIVMYRGLIVKNSVVNGIYDPDLNQQLYERFLECVKSFRI